MSERKRLLAWSVGFLVFAGLLMCYSLRSAPYVGAFNDDASYIIYALALLKGQYHNLASLDPHAMSQFWPGYPLALMPWVAALKPHWAWLRLSSIFFGFVAIALYMRLCGLYLGRALCWIAVFAFCFHPLTLQYMTAVISEPLFVALTLSAFAVLYRHLQAPRRTSLAALAFLLAYAVWVRPTGAALFGAAFVALGLRGRWRDGVGLLALASVGIAIFPLWQFAATHQRLSYINLWVSGLPLFWPHALDHLHRLLYFFYGAHLMGLRIAHDGPLRWLSVPAIALGIGVTLVGLRRMTRRDPARAALAGGMMAYVGMTIAIHAAYLSIDNRYFWPTLPYVLLFFVRGLATDDARRSPWQAPLLAVWFVALTAGSFALARKPDTNPVTRLPAHTLEWIRANVPRDAFVLGAGPALYLYTGLQGDSTLNVDNRDEFVYQVLHRRLRFVVFFPGDFNMPLSAYPSDGSTWRVMQNRRYIAELPRMFAPIYGNPEEQTMVLAIHAPPLFERAYEDYIAGVDALSAQSFEAARRDLNRSLQAVPTLSVAWTAHGIMNYMLRRYPDAVADFDKALALNADDVMANLHKARAEAVLRRPDEAARLYRRTLDIIRGTGYYRDLLPTIIAEQKALTA